MDGLGDTELLSTKIDGDASATTEKEADTQASRHYSDSEKEKLKELGCRIFSFGDAPVGQEDSYNDRIRFAIRNFTVGALSENEIETLFKNWPRNCDLALLPGMILEGSNVPTSQEGELIPSELNSLQMMKKREELSATYPRANAIIGSAAQYMAMEMKEPGLFRDISIRTSNKTELPNFAEKDRRRTYVFFEGDALDRVDERYGDEKTFAVPLLVPKQQT